MKQFIVVYASDSRGNVEAKFLVYKTVNAPDDADVKTVESVLKNTTNGPYTRFYKLIDPASLDQMTLEPKLSYKVAKDGVPKQ